MKRYVAVPSSLVLNGEIPKQALLMAKNFSLEIREVETVEQIQIFSEPVIKKIDYDKTYRDSRIWSLDITDEFVKMRNNCYLLVDNSIHYPSIAELHCLKYRIRMFGQNDKKVEIYINGTKIETIKVVSKNEY